MDPKASSLDGAEAVVDLVIAKAASEMRAVSGRAYSESDSSLARSAAVVSALLDLVATAQSAVAMAKEELDGYGTGNQNS